MLKRDGPVSTAKLSLVRKINYNTVWEYLLSNNEDSISGIAKNVGLSFPTVNRAIEYGLSINLIESGTIENTSFGRKPQTYKLNDKYAHNLAIFVDNKKIAYCVYSFCGRKITEDAFNFNPSYLESEIINLIEKNVNKDKNIKIVSVALVGIINDGKVVETWKYPQLNGLNLAERIEKKFKIYAVVENDMYAAALSAKGYLEGVNEKIVSVIQFGHNGFGSSLMINGEVLKGKGGFAGEIGYLPITIKHENFLPSCGKWIQSIISVVAPDLIVLYSDAKTTDPNKIISQVEHHIPDFAMPQFVSKRDFRQDCLRGLYFAGTEKLLEKI